MTIVPGLIEAIERYEAAIKAGGPALGQAEAELSLAICRAVCGDHPQVCEPNAWGCTEGVSHNGTVYARFHADGEPDGQNRVIVMRRVREARSFDMG